ncbi:hypothetical protein MIMGU_mgv11b023408mg [Erythranthe guttata]|uniref:Uncharacterized protein n=1 Tax=Erythranthe guttata TaxID=4155 RepID=A0A022Q1X7_ERYGU|nr:hypothetical protein MIMGU_mgv11b023408mg [Erythranthe guttata]
MIVEESLAIRISPEGDLRVYLKGLLKYDDVPEYVEQHPFGQRPIDEQHVSWTFYRQLIFET